MRRNILEGHKDQATSPFGDNALHRMLYQGGVTPRWLRYQLAFTPQSTFSDPHLGHVVVVVA